MTNRDTSTAISGQLPPRKIAPRLGLGLGLGLGGKFPQGQFS